MSSAALFLTLFGCASAAYNGSVGDGFPCWNTTVVHDVKDGWNDGCLGLKHKPKINSSAACGAQCTGDPECIVWQWVKQKTNDTECWSGNEVHGCVGRSPTPGDAAHFENSLIGGQRLQHGNVKYISSSKGVQVMGLKNYKMASNATLEVKTARCRLTCHSDVTCSVWQYSQGDCWVEHSDHKAGEKKNDTAFAAAMVAGEFIEHYCPPKPKKEEGLPWPWIIAGIVAGVILLGVLAYCLQKKPKVKKTRAVKIEPKPEPQPIMYFIPQPTVLIPQTSMIAPQYTPLMTTQAAPITTTQYTTVPSVQTPLVSGAPMVSGGVPLVSGGVPTIMS